MDHSLMYVIVLYSLLGTHARSFAKLEKTPERYFIFATCEHWQNNQLKRIFQGYFFFFNWFFGEKKKKKLIAMQKMSKNGSHREYSHD